MTQVSSSSFLNSVQVPAANGASSTPVTGSSKQLGKQDFLKLLLAQMQNQDPMKPMDDTAMIAQMAQFSSLEATQALNATMQHSNNMQTIAQAGGLIGKYITANQPDGTITTGAVTGVNFITTDGVVTPTVLVNGKDVDYSTIVKVSSSTNSSSSNPNA
jgi:flagellar basal-body rod modification protein FlgD